MDPQQAYVYCPRCKAKLDLFEYKKVTCSECGWLFYFNPIPCNAVILENVKSQLLLVRRATDPFKGYWDLPGGFVEVNESVEESIVRETKEETGIDLDPKDLKLFMTTWDRYLYKGIKDYTLGLIYSAKLAEKDIPVPADDVSETKFFDHDEIPWEHIAFDSIRMILKRYLSTKD